VHGDKIALQLVHFSTVSQLAKTIRLIVLEPIIQAIYLVKILI